jgi:TIR domain
MKQRSIVYIGLYIVIMGAVAWFPVWRVADWWIFACMHRGAASPIAREIMVVDLPYTTNLAMFRMQLAALLTDMSKEPDALPDIVVLDISIMGSDERGLDALEQAIRLLQKSKSKVEVYAGVDPRQEQTMSGKLDPGYMARHARHLYDLLDGKGHTVFDQKFGAVKYDPELELPDSLGSEHLQALPVLIAANHYSRPVSAKEEPVVLNLGDPNELRERIYTFRSGSGGQSNFTHYKAGGGGLPAEKPDFRRKIVVVGSLDKDVTELSNLSGPEVLAFAINDCIPTSASNSHSKVLATPFLLIVLMAGFAALASTLFLLLFRKWTDVQRRLWLLALLCVIASLLLLMFWIAGLLSLNYVYPQVTLIGFSIVVSTGLSWFYTKREREVKPKSISSSSDRRVPVSEELPRYDVFISYTRTPDENLAWVRKNVYEPLLKFRKTDGSALQIFFDEDSIEPGDNWHAKVALAIERSSFFLPIYTTDYFNSRFCVDEMAMALLRHIKLEAIIIPIAREEIKIPTEYSTIQYLDVQKDAHFMNRVVERIRKSEEIRPGNQGEFRVLVEKQG